MDRSSLCIAGGLASPTHPLKATHSPKSLGQPTKVCPHHWELPRSSFLVLVFQTSPADREPTPGHINAGEEQLEENIVLSTPPAPHQDQVGGWTWGSRTENPQIASGDPRAEGP